MGYDLTEEIIRITLNTVYDHRGLKLASTPLTKLTLVDEDTSKPWRPYRCHLIGPLADTENPDIRVWVQRRVLDNTLTYDLLPQDRDDDAWLNNDALGLDPRYAEGHGKIYIVSPV